MARSRLRVYYGPDAESTTLTPAKADPTQVTVPLEELLPLLAEAYMSRRTWLDDFAGDEVTLSTDLYEVLLAYRHYRRPSA